MGDMADYEIEQGMDAWIAHLYHNCLDDCIYCELDYLKEKRKNNAKKTRIRHRTNGKRMSWMV